MRDRFLHRWSAGFGCLAVAAVILVLAFAIPLALFPHQADLSDRMIDYTVGQARLGSSIPPLRLQIVEAGPDPEVAGAYADSRLVWRTLFGIPYGETTLDGRSGHNEWHHGRLLAAFAGFASVEMSLVVVGGWLFYTAP